MKFTLSNSSGNIRTIMMVVYDRRFKDGRFVYSTRERIPLEAWKGNRASKGYEAINGRLSLVEKEAAKYITDQLGPVTREDIKQYLDDKIFKNNKSTGRLTLFQEWQDYLDLMEPRIKPPTRVAYKSSFETFKEFNSDCYPEQFTLKHFMNYENVLKQKFMPNTVAKKLKHFCMMTKFLSKNGIKLGMDRDDIEYKEGTGIKLSASEAELKAMMREKLNGKLERGRDLFAIQCGTGLRVSDLYRAAQNIHGDRINGEMQKVEGKFTGIPLTDFTKPIFEKYGYKLPKINIVDYRQTIKEVYKKVNPNEKVEIRTREGFKSVYKYQLISTHDAIRTFVEVSIKKGMTIDEIARITGKSIKTLIKHYIPESHKKAEQSMIKAWQMA